MNFRAAFATDVYTCTAPPKQALCWKKFRGVDEQKLYTKTFRRKKCLCRRKMKCRGSPETRFPEVWGRSEPSSGGKRPFEVSNKFFFVEKWNVGNRPKRVLAKFRANRSLVQAKRVPSKFLTKSRLHTSRPEFLAPRYALGVAQYGLSTIEKYCVLPVSAKKRQKRKNRKTLNGRLPLEDSSDFDDFWTEWTVMTWTFILDILCFFGFVSICGVGCGQLGLYATSQNIVKCMFCVQSFRFRFPFFFPAKKTSNTSERIRTRPKTS